MGAVAAPLQSAESVVEAMERTLETINAYRCKLYVLSIRDAVQEERVFDYAFHRPKVIRMRILEGKDRGSVLVYRDGKVQGHRGGWLAWAVRTYAPSHPEIVTVRGGRADQSDLLFIVEALRHAVDHHQLSLEGVEPRDGQACYRLALQGYTEPLDADTRAGRFWIEQERVVIGAYEIYDGTGRLIYQQRHEALELNPPLAEGAFNL